MDFAENHHYDTQNGGILVWDYDKSKSPVHSSLNHQLAELQLLYQYGKRTNQEALTQLADRMLLGVEDTWQDWIREDGNLHYCRLPDGSYGKEDYPYLTYNDL